MPAYRSAAEAEIRQAVVARIRAIRPGARILHEVIAGANRIDVMAVDEAEIITVEIKSAKDKLDRLPAQLAQMAAVSSHAIVALHERFLVEQLTNRAAAHSERDGVFYLKAVPPHLQRHVSWVYPERRRSLHADGWDLLARWVSPKPLAETALPHAALSLLWREELRSLCRHLGVPVRSRARSGALIEALRWRCTGAELTHGICTALRTRPCLEGDLPIGLTSAATAAE